MTDKSFGGFGSRILSRARNRAGEVHHFFLFSIFPSLDDRRMGTPLNNSIDDLFQHRLKLMGFVSDSTARAKFHIC